MRRNANNSAEDRDGCSTCLFCLRFFWHFDSPVAMFKCRRRFAGMFAQPQPHKFTAFDYIRCKFLPNLRSIGMHRMAQGNVFSVKYSVCVAGSQAQHTISYMIMRIMRSTHEHRALT